MMPLEQVTPEVFEAVLGTTWHPPGDDQVPFTLTAVRRLPTTPGGPRSQPFALELTRRGDVVAQGTLELANDELGSMAVLVVPVGRDGDQVTYEVVFN